MLPVVVGDQQVAAEKRRPVRFDLRRDIGAFRPEGQRHGRTLHRDDRGEVLGVLEHLENLVEASHHDDSAAGKLVDGSLGADRVEIRVGLFQDRVICEVVPIFQCLHVGSPRTRVRG